MNAAMAMAMSAAVLLAGSAVLVWFGAQRHDRRSRISERLETWASGHLHESETLRFAALLVFYHSGGINLSEWLESQP